MNLRVGILTLYYNSDNYGGNLQAYALCKIIKETAPEIDAEQICYVRGGTTVKTLRAIICQGRFDKLIIKIWQRFVLKCRNATRKYRRAVHSDVYRNIDARKNAVLKFNREQIPHSEAVYDGATIGKSNAQYDAFITGSDQVWNPAYFSTGLLLTFVDDGKKKFSYAASISQDSLSSEAKETLKVALENYAAVSVREEKAVELLADLSPAKPTLALDPTLLLARKSWEEVCEERLIDEPYLFCYFLGGDVEQRKLAKAYAKRKNMKIVTIPYLLREYRACDKNFGDVKLYDVGPERFLSLIKHADCVLTDSFHAAVFSGVFQKEYFVFNRVGKMNSRIETLLSLYQTEERFCNSKEKTTAEYLLSQNPIDYSRDLSRLEEMRRSSIEFLKTNLNVD